jgi:hypothetical protein
MVADHQGGEYHGGLNILEGWMRVGVVTYPRRTAVSFSPRAGRRSG